MQAILAALDMSAAQSLLVRALDSNVTSILISLQALLQPCSDWLQIYVKCGSREHAGQDCQQDYCTCPVFDASKL